MNLGIVKQEADNVHVHEHVYEQDHVDEKDRQFVSLNDEVSNPLTSVVDVYVDVVVLVDLLVHVLVDVAGFATPPPAAMP